MFFVSISGTLVVDVLHLECNPVSTEHVVGAEDRAYTLQVSDGMGEEGLLAYQSNQIPTLYATSNYLGGEVYHQFSDSWCRLSTKICRYSAQQPASRGRNQVQEIYVSSSKYERANTRSTCNVQRVGHVRTIHNSPTDKITQPVPNRCLLIQRSGKKNITADSQLLS